MHRSVRATILSTSSIAVLGLSLAAAPAPALAQDEPLTSDRVVVTGSRIARRDFQANSPIVTVDEGVFEERSTFAVEAALNQLPQFTPGQSQNLGSGGGSPFVDAVAAPGAATLNLRGLGANRNLVLVNGRRPQPVNAQLVVDVNTIPSAAIQSVEVISGGAAAVYGSDAIAGVVNFILKEDYEGFEVDTQYGFAETGDNKQATVSLLVGGNFANDRGNAMVGGQWSERGVAYQRERDFYTDGWADPGTTAGGINNSVPGITQATIGFTTFGVNSDGSLFNVQQANNPAAPYTGPLHNLEEGAGFKLNPVSPGATFRSLGYNDPENQISIPLTRYSAFASAHYDITDSITAFFQANYTHSKTSALSLVPPAFNFWALTIPYNSANDDPDSPTFGANQANFHPVSRQLADLLNTRALPVPPGTPPVPGSAANTPWTMVRSLDFLGRLRTDTTSNIFDLTFGFDGTLPFRDWTWEAYGSHGETNVLAQQPSGNISQENLQQIINGYATSLVGGVQTPGALTATGPYGEGWTNAVGGFQTATIGSCTSGIPFFNSDGSVPTGVISVSQDCIDYATLKTNTATIIKQNIVEANAQGGLFDIWAGEVRAAFGATYRDVDFEFTPDSGLNANQARANVINNIALPRYAHGYTDVKEVYGELLIPLLNDVPFVQQFELELGGRISDYSTVGSVETYKILGDWSVNDYVRFRGGYQRATRAPNVYELFAPLASSGAFSATNDPCTNIPGFTAAYGNLPSNPNRTNLQLACAELISRDGGFAYQTLATNPNPGQPPAGDPTLDLTHLSNFRWTVIGYNFAFPITLPLVQGNPNLQSEVADTWTAGVVLTSPFEHPLLSRLSMSVDWYSIDLVGTIDTPSAILVYQQCLDPQYNPNMASAAGSMTGAQLLEGNQYCDLINREPVNAGGQFAVPGSGIDRNYDATYTNLGGTQTSGIDIVVNWAAELADLGIGFIPGSVNLNFQANWLDYYRQSPFAGGAFVDYTGTYFGAGFYDYKTFTTLSWTGDTTSLGVRVRYLPEVTPPPGSTPNTSTVASHTEVDLFGRWMISDAYELRAGIDNLLDADPEVVGRTPTNNASSSTNGNYDILGRRFFIGATARF